MVARMAMQIVAHTVDRDGADLRDLLVLRDRSTVEEQVVPEFGAPRSCAVSPRLPGGENTGDGALQLVLFEVLRQPIDLAQERPVRLFAPVGSC